MNQQYLRQICIAANDERKITSIKALLEPHNIQITTTKIKELPGDISESAIKNAERRAQYAHQKMKIPGIGIDTGLYLYALKGFPKAQKRFLEERGLRRILELIKGKRRDCGLMATLVYVEKNMFPMIYEKRAIEGIITEKPKGVLHNCNWKYLWRHFMPEGTNITIGELSPEAFESWRRELYQETCIKWFIKNFPDYLPMKAAE